MLLRFCLVPQNLRKLPLRGEMKRERRVVDDHHWALTTGTGKREWYSHIAIARALSGYPWLDRTCGPSGAAELIGSPAYIRQVHEDYHTPTMIIACLCICNLLRSRQLESVAITCDRPYHCRLAAMLPATDNTTATTTTLEYTVHYTQIPDTVRHCILNSEHFTHHVIVLGSAATPGTASI